MEVLLLVWILGAFLCGIAAMKHRSAAAWGFASLVFSPLLTLLALIAVPALPGRGARGRQRVEEGCLSCGGPIAGGGRLCAECRSGA